MRDFLNRVNITGLDVDSYIQADKADAIPNIGIAVSGGGYRAMLNGAGVIAAFDSQTPNSNDSGHLGGLLQSSTYLVGLSGGSWLVGSLYVNNYTTIQSLLNDAASGAVWQLSNSVLQGPEGEGLFEGLNSSEYFSTILDQVEGKSNAGYNTSITDYWGRALSFQLINAADGGPELTWSTIANSSGFASGIVPFPIAVADGRAEGEIDIPSNATAFEFNPFEMGSFDPTVYGFASLEYFGAQYSGGILADSESCVVGFDSASFVMGTSSSLFNEIAIGVIDDTSIPGFFINAINGSLQEHGKENIDLAIWAPNPFYGWNNNSNPYASSSALTLVDGGEDGENIPFDPLIQPLRGLDVIFAIDSSADNRFRWPNGTAIRATYSRSLASSDIDNHTSFPAIPDDNTFCNLGLNAHPTFFGCNASNQTGPTPLIVYIPNAPVSAFSNTSTFNLTYSDEWRDTMIQNGYDVATRGNGSLDSQWPTCVGCAVLSRSLERTKTQVPEVCQKCFEAYCWNGTLDTAPATYEPNATQLSELNATSGAGHKNAAFVHMTPVMFAILLSVFASAFVL